MTVKNCSYLFHKFYVRSKQHALSHYFFSSKNSNGPRINPINIQMLSKRLHEQIFGKLKPFLSPNEVEKSIKHLKEHKLWGCETEILSDIEFKLPKLLGNNIDEHFRELAERQIKTYLQLSEQLACSVLPPLPSEWKISKGWTKYVDDQAIAVLFPDEQALVLDVEVCMSEGLAPTLATAVSTNAWYSWCSERLVEDRFSWSKKMTLQDLIPIESKLARPAGDWTEKVIVGHHVSFDRSYLQEQYILKGPKTRFLDTMSLHIAISGLTSYQRALLVAKKTGSQTKEVQEAKSKMRGPPNIDWMNLSSLNNLTDVHQLYCGGDSLNKEPRELFIEGSLKDIRQNVQALMTYCAGDVIATHDIFKKLLPLFFERFPHPVTFSGMLEMSTAYFPVNYNWEHYLQEAQGTFDDLQKELKLSLVHLANDACQLLHENKYKDDPWLWDLDWSCQNIKMKKELCSKASKKAKLENKDETTEEKIEKILSTVNRMPKRRPHLPGYPTWYRELCPKSKENEEFLPGPQLISTQVRVTPKLLRLTWDGYPLHYNDTHGWGYLVPGRKIDIALQNEQDLQFPLKNLLAICTSGKLLVSKPVDVIITSTEQEELDAIWDKIDELSADGGELDEIWKLFRKANRIQRKKSVKHEDDKPDFHYGNGPFNDVMIPGCWFFKLPHKDGNQLRVGNPLAKDFLNKLEDGTLRASCADHSNRVLKLSKTLSYWKNAKKRILSQMVIWLNKNELPRSVVRHPSYIEDGWYGAILPRVITSGTLTRRAVEPVWLTASNAYADRVGSELKSMIQVPPGYHMVGADVDSQELWIAGVLGDAHFAKMHGCSAFGWMTLQGKKKDGTDMHSKTAASVGISREQAKVLNYGRIYGAGLPFAERLLMQFNHHLTQNEANVKAKQMYATTKGVRKYVLNENGREVAEEINPSLDPKNPVSISELKKLHSHLRKDEWKCLTSKRVWVGGSESEMFNKLENIAQSPEPATPVLNCRISTALEPKTVGENFMTSRINWVVQSSAVDYLHLMLVCMRWLFTEYDIDGRFCISIHDEVRYLVKSEDRYRAALALQITNLFTRCMFAYKLGLYDLPQSVAFFSSVDIDTVLRKEVTMDCKTPSNPHGLEQGYNIPPGEALDIYSILKITNGSLLKSSHSSPEKPKNVTSDMIL